MVCGCFRVTELLGKGGMGLVYGAVREPDGQRVAVKVLSLGHGADWKGYELFERGTQVLMQLRHPALPTIHAFEKSETGRLVLVRERFDGGSLEDRVLREKRVVGPAEPARFLVAMLDLLAYLHGRVPPVLHRDIKAPNIMFRGAADWDPVLVDFDTVAAPGSQATRTTLVVSPGYTAPEQYAGDVSPASDLYSLGATLLLLATRTLPDELPRRDGRFLLAGRLDSLDPTLREVVQRLVEPEKARRYASAADVLADLRRAKSPPHPPPVPERSPAEALQAPQPEAGPRAIAFAASPGPRDPAAAEYLAALARKGLPAQEAAAEATARAQAAAEAAQAEAARRIGTETLTDKARRSTTIWGYFATIEGGALYGVAMANVLLGTAIGVGYDFEGGALVFASLGWPLTVATAILLVARWRVSRAWAGEISWYRQLPFPIAGYVTLLGDNFSWGSSFSLGVQFHRDAPGTPEIDAALHGLLRGAPWRWSVEPGWACNLVLRVYPPGVGDASNRPVRNFVHWVVNGLLVPLHRSGRTIVALRIQR